MEHVITHFWKGKFMKKAFTLVEVLITLGIIGVVAALTIPALITKYQKLVWINGLKSAYSLFDNGFKRILASEGVEYLSDTSVFQSIGGEEWTYAANNKKAKRCYHNLHNADSDNCNAFFINLGKYFKFVKIEDVPCQFLDDKSNWIWYLNSPGNKDYNYAKYFCGPKFVLSNGMIIFHARYRSNPLTNMPHGIMIDWNIDINGNKGPNTYGRDVYHLNIFDDGSVVPTGSKYYSLDSAGDAITRYWSTTESATYNCISPNESSTESWGFGCAARIIENGWKMDY